MQPAKGLGDPISSIAPEPFQSPIVLSLAAAAAGRLAVLAATATSAESREEASQAQPRFLIQDPGIGILELPVGIAKIFAQNYRR